jgi:murein DD-endopeptidase MepM/ murein hydrolase activator NlpD
MPAPVPLLVGAGGLLLLLAAAPRKAEARSGGARAWPVPPLPARWLRVLSPFGWRIHPIYGDRRHHDGIDLPAPVGTPIYAPEAGVVDRVDHAGAGRGEVNGNAVFVKSAGHRWAFLHLSRVLVAPGATVRAGQNVGLVGDTGRTTGPHLHLQVWDAAGHVVDPEPLFAAGTFTGAKAVA